jgi:hypothetical protein
MHLQALIIYNDQDSDGLLLVTGPIPNWATGFVTPTEQAGIYETIELTVGKLSIYILPFHSTRSDFKCSVLKPVAPANEMERF